MGRPKIYDVKTATAKNYQKLISEDNAYFYWNGKHFSNNDIGDHIFVVNRHNKEALFTQIEKKDISVEYNQEKNETTFEDLGKKYSAESKWDDFIRFEIIESSKIPEGWNWATQLGFSETCNLFTENIADIPKKKEKIADLIKLFPTGQAKDALIHLERLLENNGEGGTLKNLFLKVLSAYPVATDTRPPEIADVIKNKLPISIKTALGHNPIINKWNNEYSNFCYGKVGAGSWAAVPWVAILNPKITKSVSRGVYIVYLFHANGKGVYLTLAQGTGGIEKAHAGEAIENMRKGLLAVNRSGYFMEGPLHTDSLSDHGNSRTRAYEKSCILWKFYSKENLNELTDNQIVSDLNEIIEIYSKFEEKIISLSSGRLSGFIQIMRRYKDEGTVFQSPSQGARYFISDVDESGCTVQRLDAREPEKVTENLFQSKLEMVRNNDGKYRFNDLDGTAATRTTVLQGPHFGLSHDKNAIFDLSDDDKACDVFCEIVKTLQVDTVDGKPRLYKPAMVACIVEALESGELSENRIEFDWIDPRFIEKMKSLGVDATIDNTAMPFFHLTGDLFWMLCYQDTGNIIDSGSASPGTIRSRVRHSIIKDIFWRILQKQTYRNKVLAALAEKWWPEGTDMTGIEIINHIYDWMEKQGFVISKADLINFYCCLRTKPFVLLAGISGTGKTKLVRLFAEAVGATEENHRFQLIPVRPDWNDNSELMGFFDLNNRYQSGALVPLLIRAHSDPGKPFFLCLDEMNLARVEHYFSDFLSIIESRRFHRGNVITDQVLSKEQMQKMNTDTLDDNVKTSLTVLMNESTRGLSLPDNLYVIGTVNMDETTHPFSRKVLDRANTIEFSDIHLTKGLNITKDQPEPTKLDLDNNAFRAQYLTMIDLLNVDENIPKEVAERLNNLNNTLAKAGCQIGYRVRDEAAFYMKHVKEIEDDILNQEAGFERVVLQKILPRLQGSSYQIKAVLEDLLKQYDHESREFNYDDEGYTAKMQTLIENKGPLVKKIGNMLIQFMEDGFTSFWAN